MSERLAIVVEQERRLVFPSFNEQLAFEVGSTIRELAVAEDKGIVCDIRLWDRPLFYMALPGTTADSVEWARRKANVVRRYGKSTYRMVLEKGAGPDNRELPAESHAPLTDYVLAGGGFPIRVAGAGIIGAVTVSGIPEHLDHMLVVTGIIEVLGISIDGLTLPELP